MKNTLPKEIQFFLCDQVRQEPFSKISLLGMYMDNEIVFQPKPEAKSVKPPFRMAGLAIVFSLKGGRGEFAATLQILDPRRQEVTKPVKLGTQRLREKPHLIGVQFSAIEFKSVGQYKVLLDLDKKRYEFPVSISKRSKKETLART